jgi:hypothetical protein
MADNDRTSSSSGNEGEGSRTADRRYREGVEETVRRGRVSQDAEQAGREVEERPEEHRRAEEAGRERSAGDAPGDLEP